MPLGGVVMQKEEEKEENITLLVSRNVKDEHVWTEGRFIPPGRKSEGISEGQLRCLGMQSANSAGTTTTMVS